MTFWTQLSYIFRIEKHKLNNLKPHFSSTGRYFLSNLVTVTRSYLCRVIIPLGRESRKLETGGKKLLIHQEERKRSHKTLWISKSVQMYMQPGSTPINMKHLTNITLREKKRSSKHTEYWSLTDSPIKNSMKATNMFLYSHRDSAPRLLTLKAGWHVQKCIFNISYYF